MQYRGTKGKLLAQKPPLKLKEIWATRIRLRLTRRCRELALFNLAIDSKLRGCDLVGLRVHDVLHCGHVAPRAIVMQKKTQRPVQFEGLEPLAYGTHSLRRTKATLIYRRTRNLRAVQLLLGHTKLESTVRNRGIEVDDAWRSRSRQRSRHAKLIATVHATVADRPTATVVQLEW
jgi:hypothetical protein